MALPARRRAEKLRIDQAVGRVYAHAKHDGPLLRALGELHREVVRRSPLLRPIARPAGHDPVQALRNLARFHPQFRRPVAEWAPSGRSIIELVASLATHLLGRYPTPRFLASVWFGADRPEERARRRWFVDHSRGMPFRRVGLPVEMTRRMEDLFLRSPDHLDVVAAMRRAEVLALGGTEVLTAAVIATRLGFDTEHADFWRTVVRFLVRHQEALRPAQVRTIVEGLHYLRHERVEVHTRSGVKLEDARAPHFSLKGRSLASLLRLLENECGDPELAWEPSGLRGLVYEDEQRWSVVELLDRRRLNAEGNALRHCVRLYAPACRAGRSSIWSIRRQPRSGAARPVLTVEVDPAKHDVVQARGRFDAQPTARAREILDLWARREGLSVSLIHNRE